MKKTFFLLSGLLASTASIVLVTTSCKKTEEVVPVAAGINSVTNVVLNNQNGTSYKFAKVTGSSVVIVTSTGADFDLGYFSGYTENDKYYFSSDNYYAVAAEHPAKPAEAARTAVTYTTYYSVSGVSFDAVSSLADLKSAIESSGAQTGDGTTLKSSVAWEVGYTFGFKTRDGIYGLAKVVTSPTGYNYFTADPGPVVEVPVKVGPASAGRIAGWNYVAGSVTLSIKYAKVD